MYNVSYKSPTSYVIYIYVTFGTARRGMGGAAALPGPSSLYQM